MAAITLACGMCGRWRPYTEHEVKALVIAFGQGDVTRLRCPTCGTSLARPLQRALNLPPAVRPPSAEGRPSRRHARFPFDLPASFREPGGPAGWGQVKNLSDGGLLLLTREILPPSTHLRVDVRTRRGVRTFAGEVRWNDAERRSRVPPIAHGIRFACPVPQELAVELFLLDAMPR